MKEQLLGSGRKAWDNFRAFSPGQKAVTILATLALVVGGYLFMSWKNKPDYAPLYTNLAATDAAAIVDKLNAQKIPYQLAAGGAEIDVPKDKVYATRLAMSSAGLPGSGQSGYSLLDKEGVTTSEFKQQVDYQRAIEGELAKTIGSINGITAASVHLAIPKQDVFNDGTSKTTAAVMLTTAGGAQLTAAQVQSIVYLVSSSVPHMNTGDVTVTDSTGRVLAAPGDDLGGLAGTDNQVKMTADYNKRVADGVQKMIDAAIGPGHAVVTVNADLDFNQTSTTTNRYTYDPDAPPVSQQESSETYTGTGTGPGGTLGAGTPAVDTVNPNGANGGGNYAKTSKTVNSALGTVSQTTHNAPGAVKKLNVAVLLDKGAKNVDVAGIETLVKSAVGLDAARGDSLAVQAMQFDQSGQQAADAATKAAGKATADKAASERQASLIKQGILAGLLLVILVGTWLASRRRRRGAQIPPPPLDDSFYDEQESYLPPQPIQPLAPVSDFDEARQRRRALVALADEQPDDVARVLSGWLNAREG